MTSVQNALAEQWLVSTARKAGPHGVTPEQENLMRIGFLAGVAASPQEAQPDIERECAAVDELLLLLGLDPERCRTEGGRLNVARIKALLIDLAVDRFLGWPLPRNFAPDCGVSFDGRKDDEWNKNKTWPVGTNLLTAEQARAMFTHALAAQPTRERLSMQPLSNAEVDAIPAQAHE